MTGKVLSLLGLVADGAICLTTISSHSVGLDGDSLLLMATASFLPAACLAADWLVAGSISWLDRRSVKQCHGLLRRSWFVCFC